MLIERCKTCRNVLTIGTCQTTPLLWKVELTLLQDAKVQTTDHMDRLYFGALFTAHVNLKMDRPKTSQMSIEYVHAKKNSFTLAADSSSPAVADLASTYSKIPLPRMLLYIMVIAPYGSESSPWSFWHRHRRFRIYRPFLGHFRCVQNQRIT